MRIHLRPQRQKRPGQRGDPGLQVQELGPFHRVVQDGTGCPQPYPFGCSLEALLQGLYSVATGLLEQSNTMFQSVPPCASVRGQEPSILQPPAQGSLTDAHGLSRRRYGGLGQQGADGGVLFSG